MWSFFPYHIEFLPSSLVTWKVKVNIVQAVSDRPESIPSLHSPASLEPQDLLLSSRKGQTFARIPGGCSFHLE